MNLKANMKWILSAVFLLAILVWVPSHYHVNMSELLKTLGQFSALSLIAAFLFVVFQQVFYIFRFYLLVPRRIGVRFIRVARAMIYGNLVNTFFPARAGDILKVVLLARGQSNDSAPVAAGVLVSDKIVDVCSLLLLILLTGAYKASSLTFDREKATSILSITLGVLVAVAFIGWLLIRRSPQRFSWIRSIGDGVAQLRNLSQSLSSLVISFCGWSFESKAVMILCAAQGFTLTFSQAVFVLAFLNLMIAVPVSAANIGPFEGAIAFALNQFGIPVPVGVVIATVHHGIQVLAIVVQSGVMVLLDRFSGSEPQTQTTVPSDFKVALEDKKKAIEYFEKTSKEYDETVNKGFLKNFRLRERNAMLNFLDLQPTKSLIDVGCGAGFYALEGKRAGMFVRAVDASPGMVMKLEGKVDEAEVVDVEKMETDRLFDRVVCAGVLDFVLHPEEAFRNLCKLVAPQGRLVVLSPRKGLGGFYYRIEKFFFGMKINVYTRNWYEKIAREYGLILVDFAHPLPTNMALLFERA